MSTVSLDCAILTVSWLTYFQFMQKTKTDKRSRLIQTAAKLAYRQGFRKTTLADIAEEAQVPLGNVYYYFKTKDEFAAAVVEYRLEGLKKWQQSWEEMDSPQERLCACVQSTAENAKALARGGCSVGTLCTELRKEGGGLGKLAAVIFTEYLAWVEVQFRAMGGSDDARGLAIHLLSALQGIAVLSNSFEDPSLVALETGRLKNWIRAM
jgi:TetR/AcrR family transcriptional regulator, transcriptional repressor for nem operon